MRFYVCLLHRQYSLSSGDKGINAFLMKEKSDNPFYKADFKSDKPSGGPSWLSSVKLPQLDFVEVYGQSGGGGGSGQTGTGNESSPELKTLYRRLDAAVEKEDYEEAARVKAEIDETLLSS